MDTSLYSFFITILAIAGWTGVALQMREKERQEDKAKQKETMDYYDLRIRSLDDKIEDMRTHIEDQFDVLDDGANPGGRHGLRQLPDLRGRRLRPPRSRAGPGAAVGYSKR